MFSSYLSQAFEQAMIDRVGFSAMMSATSESTIGPFKWPLGSVGYTLSQKQNNTLCSRMAEGSAGRTARLGVTPRPGPHRL